MGSNRLLKTRKGGGSERCKTVEKRLKVVLFAVAVVEGPKKIILPRALSWWILGERAKPNCNQTKVFLTG